MRFLKALAFMIPLALASCVIPGQDAFPGSGDDLPVVIARDDDATNFEIPVCPNDDYVQHLELSDGKTFATAKWVSDKVETSTEMRTVSVAFAADQVVDNSILTIEGLQPLDDGALPGKEVTIVGATTFRGEAGFELDEFVPEDGVTYLVRGNPAAGGSVEPLAVPAEEIFEAWCGLTSEPATP